MKVYLFTIVWAAAQYAFLLPLVILVAACMGYRIFRIKKVLQLLAGVWKVQLFKHVSFVRQVTKVLFMIGATLCIILALMRPQWNKKEEIVAQEGRDLFIALDISRSMLAGDIAPNRISYAKKKIQNLVASLHAERVGLLLFSGSAFVQCPLTTDYSAFNLYLNQVDVETISSGTTALDQVLKEAIRVFSRAQGRKNKLLVLVTDGEDFSSQLDMVKQEAKQLGLHIFALGVGTKEGAPIPLYDEQGDRAGHQKDDKGAIVITRLNEPLLRSLTQDVGGMYVAGAQDDVDIKQIVSTVKSFEKEKFDDITVNNLEDHYHYFLLVAFICCIVEWLL